MNSKNIIAIKNEKIRCTCMKCLNEYDESHLHMIHIPGMGYGSGFDLTDMVLILCDDCYKESIKDEPNLWNMKVVPFLGDLKSEEEKKDDIGDLFAEYEFDNKMWDYIRSLPLAGKELVDNRLSKYMGRISKINGQDWIDMQLGEGSYEMYKKNGWVSPQERKSYHENYERCVHVKNVISAGGNKNSHCFINPLVTGLFGGKCLTHGQGHGCYQCNYFIERKGKIETFNDREVCIKDYEQLEQLGTEMKPDNRRKRLSIIKYKHGRRIVDAVVIRVESKRVFIVDRDDFMAVLKGKKQIKNINTKWIDESNYLAYLGDLDKSRETTLKEIEDKAKALNEK